MQGDNNSTSDVTWLQTQQNYRWCQTATVTAILLVRLNSYRVKAKLQEMFHFDSKNLGFICAGVSNVDRYKRNTQYSLICLLQI